MTDDLSLLLNQLKEVTASVDSASLRVAKEEQLPPTEELAEMIATVHSARDTLKATFDSLCQVLATAMGDQAEIRSSSGILVEKRWAKPRKTWRHQELASVVASRIRSLAIDPDTGEVLMSPEEQISELLRYAAPSYWRVKELKVLGIDADGYCETGESTPSIVVRPNL